MVPLFPFLYYSATSSPNLGAFLVIDAVNDLKDFLLKFPMVMEKHLSGICNKLVELMLDSSGDVRMALYALFDEVLPVLPESLVSPFFPLFVAYISTGMTHVNGAVRLDALQYSNLWLHYHPALVAKFHSKLLPHYLTLMTMRDPPPKIETSDKIRRLQKEKKGPHEAKLHVPNTLKMKNVLLASLYDLVVAQLGHAELYGAQEDINLEMSRNARKHLHLGALEDAVASGTFPRVSAIVVPLQPSYSLASIVEHSPALSAMGSTKIESTSKQNEDMSPTESKLHLDEPECFKYFFTTVFPLLLNQWLECDPENLVPHALKPIESILKLFDFLLSHLDSLIGGDSDSQQAKFAFLEPYLGPVKNYVFSQFPFDYPPNWTEDELSLVTHLNVLIAMLGSHFYSRDTASEPWASSIIEYTHRAFIGNISRPTGRRAKATEKDTKRKGAHSSSISDGDTALDAVHFQIVGELLPVIRRLTMYSEPEQRNRLLMAFQRFNDACPPKSSSKRMCITFLASLLLSNDDFESDKSDDDDDRMEVDSSPTNQQSVCTESNPSNGNDDNDAVDEEELMPIPFKPKIHPSSIPADICDSLLISLPKTLWQLQRDHPVTSHLIVGLLCHFGATNSPLQRSQFERLQPALVPFFWTSIAKKSHSKKKSSTVAKSAEGDQASAAEESRKPLFGPFVSLPDHVQRASVDLLSNFAPLSEAMVESVLHAFSSPKVSVETISYLFESLDVSNAHFPSVGDFAGFALSFLVSIASFTLVDDKDNKYRLQRCFLVARMVARCCARLNLKEVFLELVDEHLISILESISTESISNDDEYVLAVTMVAFVGAYMRHSGLDSISPEGGGATLTDTLCSSLMHICYTSASSSDSPTPSHFKPGMLMIKDVFFALPEATFGKVLRTFHNDLSARKVRDSDATLLLDLVTKYRSPQCIEVLKSSLEIKMIIASIKEHMPNDNRTKRSIAELDLLQTYTLN